MNNTKFSSSSQGSTNSGMTNHSDVAKLANIKHNVDIGLKVSTKRCVDHGCPLYGKLKCTNQARSHISKRSYITRGRADCHTKSVVYMIECKRCDRQYIGQTGQTLKEDSEDTYRK